VGHRDVIDDGGLDVAVAWRSAGMEEDVAARARDEAPPCAIGVYPDGPYLVRGSFELRDASGRVIGVRRRTIALCRCGRTRTEPFCDGTHKATGFTTRAPEPAPRAAGAGAAGAVAAESPSG